MIYVLFNKGTPVYTTHLSPYSGMGISNTGAPLLREFPGVEYDEVKSRWEFKSLEEVEAIAKQLSTENVTFLGVDAGESVSPRFDIIEAPKVGDEVSYAFNGDYTPCGRIEKITKGWRITTSEGKVFNRKKNSGCWMMVGGTFRLVAGYHNEYNMEV